MATRTDTKRRFRRDRILQYPPHTRMIYAYEWLRAALDHLERMRDPSPAGRAGKAALGPGLARDAAVYLLECARRLDDAIPSSATGTWESRENARRDRMAAALATAGTPMEQLRRSADWARSSAVQLTRCQRKYTLSPVVKADCLGVRDQVTAAASEYLMALAERAEAGDGQ